MYIVHKHTDTVCHLHQFQSVYISWAAFAPRSTTVKYIVVAFFVVCHPVSMCVSSEYVTVSICTRIFMSVLSARWHRVYCSHIFSLMPKWTFCSNFHFFQTHNFLWCTHSLFLFNEQFVQIFAWDWETFPLLFIVYKLNGEHRFGIEQHNEIERESTERDSIWLNDCQAVIKLRCGMCRA